MTLQEAIRNCEEDTDRKEINSKVVCRHCKKVYDLLYLELTGITRCEKCNFKIKTRFYEMIKESRGTLRSKREERKKRFGQELMFYRKTNRYTTKEIAEILGIHQGTINAYERGLSAPTQELQEKIYITFGIKY